MSQVKQTLFDAFRQDHATLGRGLHRLRERLVAGDLAGIREAADRLDREAGAHIAFEEEDFYPALERFLSRSEIEDMYREHADGAALVRQAKTIERDTFSPEQQSSLIRRVDAMEEHVSECGELFGAMGGLTPAEQDALFARLRTWRDQRPTWSDYAASPKARR